MKTTEPIKPCAMPCAKCGGIDIHRRFYATGQDTNGVYRKRTPSSPWVNREDAFYQPAKKECVTHHCRCCGYEWETDPLTVPAARNAE